ncbi:Tripartite-type tricarboxylate transporter, receptor component TctC [Enhydrobacter aerosaccus]|uniref:Tripartite-type tricarboxylate transporter, receptor component TctC n=1 Tax=Enhydrobacter aerosaccus TaxID=225324 RepID=A0A1T4MQZ9_9HYPH|nr:tripartite tricarboxylate transporter substrate-binding protein [Enhydrobacter aerosaccus]SJZ69432.1 Tripartite-type tricarboxylate transporter, receptor component TctC [Enhydrobacter aerosaccus]
MNRLPRRRPLIAGILSAAVSSLPFGGRSQSRLPDKSLRILVGFAAGGGSELMARVIAPQLERRIGRRVSVQNKPSGADIAAGDLFKRDLGQGLIVAFMPSTTLPTTPTGSPFPFDSQSKLVPLTTAGPFQIAFAVAPRTGIKTFADYVAWVKAEPKERARLGTTATDLYLQTYALMIGRALDVSYQIIPHQGAAPLVEALAEGSVPAGIGSVTTVLEHNFGGEVKILATSGARRAWVLRDIPTLKELGYPGLELQDWYGFFASSASPPEIIAEWNRQLEAVLLDKEVMAALAQLGCDVETCTLAEAAARLAANIEAWTQRMRAVGIKMKN